MHPNSGDSITCPTDVLVGSTMEETVIVCDFSLCRLLIIIKEGDQCFQFDLWEDRPGLLANFCGLAALLASLTVLFAGVLLSADH